MRRREKLKDSRLIFSKAISKIILVCVSALLIASLSACNRETPTSENVATPTPAASAPAPIQWSEVTAAYDNVKDYTCLYEKEEKAISNGEKQVIKMAFRKPFDIKLEWVDDKGKVDQEAVYRKGIGDDKVIAKVKGGLLALAGEQRFSPNETSPDSKHPIAEAGIGKLIEQIVNGVKRPDVTSRYVGEESLDDGRAAWKFEFIGTSGALMPIPPDARRALVWLDKELKMPLKVELYDANSTLLERHRFKDLKFNVGLNDKTFVL
ncbi:MAG: hypothetical protein NVSMB56_19400 [Pyrinomonadaceae bacterium]